MSNPKIITVKPPKLTKTQKNIIVSYLTKKTSTRVAAQKMGGSPTRIYGLVNTILRDAVSKDHINIEKLLENY